MKAANQWTSYWSTQILNKYIPVFRQNTYTKNYGGTDKGLLTISSAQLVLIDREFFTDNGDSSPVHYPLFAQSISSSTVKNTRKVSNFSLINSRVLL